MPTSMLGGLAFRGIYLARILREEGFLVIETYPSGWYHRMGGADSGPLRPVDAVVARLGGFEHRLDGAGRNDEIDAVAAAIAAADFLAGTAEEIRGPTGSADDGVIYLPAVTVS